MTEKYQIPEVYEEAVKRKKEVLEMINSYNEALLLGQELPYSDEEIEFLQEEYEILNDHLKLTEEEKIRKLNEADTIKLDDGSIVEKKTILDKIHWFIYIYAFISTIFASGVLTKAIGNGCMNGFINNYFTKLSENINTYVYPTDSSYTMSIFSFWFKCIFSYTWLSLLIIVLSVVVYLVFRKKGKVNAIITKYILIFHVVLAIVVFIILFFTYIRSYWSEYYESINLYYYMWYVGKYGSYLG